MTNHECTIPVITLDGPAGVGKGTMSILLTEHLDWHLLDSGAIYRACAVAAQRQGIDLRDIPALAACAASLDLDFEIEHRKVRVLLDGIDSEQEVRSEAAGNDASQIAAYGEVRAALLQRQRDFRRAPGLVADGRDMGTVVFPDAQAKFFLDANPEARAQRRYKQLKEKGISANLRAILEDLHARDARDRQRQSAPLKAAEDAHVIDTSDLNIQQVFALLLDKIF